MTDVSFDRLRDVALREAWAHESLAFTPWLARNIEHIADAVGIPLEITGTEVSVGSFYADILGQTPDGGVVLIENQLEQTDHTHLGQIMTYLAGLEAKMVIWIAPSFREPHLSAIRWLNLNTADGFSFFALRLRVVRIGDSPYAPIFEVVEKPNGWERDVHAKVEATASAANDRYAAFWSAFLDRHPEAARRGLKVIRDSNLWLPSPPQGTILGLFITRKDCGVYLRGPSKSNFDEIVARFEPCRDALEERLGVPAAPRADLNWLYVSQIARSYTDEANWPEMIDFMEERSKLYLATLTELFGNPDP
ncbi:hypothetical protein [Amaricoccus solimangrovi]|uniref:DUF4268 domain-containing protein n=1 Tax=Amaricoccus solimangrovi TaxID=2589815 RepID=A0A501WGJ4_9RHOB|nr:hypothetical protein [Amaricoccus solimangrovi]TPE47174.1 hypothetical protein FJM51_20635 [Amaricoccus solimangrovi]